MSDAGVIGYAPRNSGRPERCDAAISPYASARLPLMLRYVPGGTVAGFTSYETPNASVVSPKFQPALKAVMLASATSGRCTNLVRMKSSVDSVGREYIHDSSPSANMFLLRPASLRES